MKLRSSIIGLLILLILAYLKRRWIIRQTRKLRARNDAYEQRLQTAGAAVGTLLKLNCTSTGPNSFKIIELKPGAPMPVVEPRPLPTISNLLSEMPSVPCGHCGQRAVEPYLPERRSPDWLELVLRCHGCGYALKHRFTNPGLYHRGTVVADIIMMELRTAYDLFNTRPPSGRKVMIEA